MKASSTPSSQIAEVFVCAALGNAAHAETERVSAAVRPRAPGARAKFAAEPRGGGSSSRAVLPPPRGALVEPLERDLDGRDLVLVPTGAASRRALGIASAAAGPHSDGLAVGVALVLAPGRDALVLAARLGHRVSCSWRGRGSPKPRRRSGGSRRPATRGPAPCRVDDATAQAVARALEGRRLAHVAAHGTFRADNPQFSSLELADGPLTVYDLERIARPPQWIVLSACDAGRSAVHPGRRAHGHERRPVVAGDAGDRVERGTGARRRRHPVMVTLHEELARGRGLARALATAQAVRFRPVLEFGDLASGDAGRPRGAGRRRLRLPGRRLSGSGEPRAAHDLPAARRNRSQMLG